MLKARGLESGKPPSCRAMLQVREGRERAAALLGLQYGDSQRWWGRNDAMDWDKRWERIKIVGDAIVGGEGASLSEGKGVVDEIKASYEKKEKELTDEFSKPIIVNGTAERSKARVIIHSSLMLPRLEKSSRDSPSRLDLKLDSTRLDFT
ncbi:hypothetical protein DFH09DRAFT_1096720 [Mycena vulgaris]|nr:hypothetical protein DFH09DRAFT_1096720 [Mycena vulgaris]